MILIIMLQMGNYFLGLQDKKAAEKILSIYWFIILIITVAGIYGMVMFYYSHPYDIRQVEASLLANKIADCVSYGGQINSEVFNYSDVKISDEFKDNFLNNCNITFNVESHKDWKAEQYYLEINFYRQVSDSRGDLGKIIKGNSEIKDICDATDKEYERLPKCVNKRFFTLYGTDLILIDIVTGVRKSEKNVK